MTAPSESFFTIGRKLGLVYVVLVLLLAVVCATVVLQLRWIRADARQLLEETREAGISSRLLVEIRSLEGYLHILREVGPTVPAVREAALVRVEAVCELLDRIDHGPPDAVDPSRREHQAAESELSATIRAELSALEPLLLRETVPPGEFRLERSRRYAEVLAGETREEAEAANADLQLRTRNAAVTMFATVIGVGLALCGALWFVLQSIVAPIRELRDRAERFGAGDFEAAAVQPHRRDEIGLLSRAFETMAMRVGATQDELQARVEKRTRELIRAARYADIGVLAAGVAHEINNPLASIASCAEGLERRLTKGDVPAEEQLDYLRTIAAEAYRARGITSRLLELAREETRPDTPVDLSSVIRQVEMMTRHQLELRHVDLAMELTASGALVRGDAGELLQLVTNLVLNARDASPAGGTVRLRVDRVGHQVIIVVDDEGAGVPAEIADRIFDPFFTTKAAGEGTGLGLALVAAIAEGHDGTVDVGRSPDGGARFTVRLPALDVEEPAS